MANCLRWYLTCPLSSSSLGIAERRTAHRGNLYSAHSVLIGASGMVYWMAGFWITLYGFVERSHSVPIRLLRVSGVALILPVPQEFQMHVSYLAHAAGFVLGIVAGIVFFGLKREEIRKADEWDLVEPLKWPHDWLDEPGLRTDLPTDFHSEITCTIPR